MPKFSLRRLWFGSPTAVAEGQHPATTERGYQAAILPSWGSMVDESNETNPDLVWPHSIDVFDRMRKEDPQVGSVLRAVMLPIRRTQWMIDPAGARDEVVEHIAADLGLPIKGRAFQAPLRTRDRFSWDEHLRLALLQLVFGHSFFEQVYRVDDAGMVHLKKLAWRPPRTISDIKVSRTGGLIGIRQHNVEELIPVDDLVAYVNEREGANWLGTSLLRTAYKMWLLKDRGLRTQSLTLERNGLGIPVYTAAPYPDDTEDDAARREAWEASEKAAGLKLATGFRAGDAAGASIPHGSTLDLKGVQGKLPDTDQPIRYYDEQIARAVLAHFLNLGTETGSWALGSTFADFFTSSLNAVSSQVEDIAQQHVVEDLVDLNWGESEPAPRIVATQIGEDQPATAEAIRLLTEAGIVIPDEQLEAYMRSRYRLPVKDATTSRVTPEPDADGDSQGGV